MIYILCYIYQACNLTVFSFFFLENVLYLLGEYYFWREKDRYEIYFITWAKILTS